MSALVLLIALDAAPSEPNVRLAILPVVNLSQETNSAHWRFLIPGLLHLGAIRSIRVLPESSLAFGLRQLDMSHGESVTPDQARSLGKLIGATHIIWGGYNQEGSEWKLRVEIVATRSADATNTLAVSSGDWLQLVSRMRGAILQRLHVTPSPEEERRLRRPTDSPQALEIVSRAYAAGVQGGSLAEFEAAMRKAISLDRGFAKARLLLAYALIREGKLDQALNAAKQVLEAEPDDSEAHYYLGAIYWTDGVKGLAREQFSEAIRLAPDYAEAHTALGGVYAGQDNWNQAAAAFAEAARLEPFSPTTHAQLARAHAQAGERSKALTELALAERYDPGADPGLQLALAETYGTLNDLPSAIAHYEKFCHQAKQVGQPAESIAAAEATLQDLTARLTPHFLTTPEPRTFAPGELDKVLREKLEPSEYAALTNPFAATPDMNRWARNLAGSAGEDIEKARRLFLGVTQHININRQPGRYTAPQAFKAWSHPAAAIACVDYAFLYVALARSLGLPAFLVTVEKDYRGEVVGHACAGVFIEGKLLLADPAYAWFGAPHRKYEVEDDVRAIGIYLCQFQDPACLNAGSKLIPDLPLPHFGQAVTHAVVGQIKEAEEALQEGLKADSTSWWSHYAQATVAWARKDWVSADAHLQRCLSLSAQYPGLRCLHAAVLQAQGRLTEARDEYRAYLQGETTPGGAAQARAAIAKINQINKEPPDEK
jgi:tetratricopeptide (TPR) repeat protein